MALKQRKLPTTDTFQIKGRQERKGEGVGDDPRKSQVGHNCSQRNRERRKRRNSRTINSSEILGAAKKLQAERKAAWVREKWVPAS